MSAYPDECRGHAERCWAMASQITNPVLRDMHKPLASSSEQERRSPAEGCGICRRL